jgi:hypothetical protein
MNSYYVHSINPHHSAEMADLVAEGWTCGITTTKHARPETKAEFGALFAKEVDARKVCHELNNPEAKR